MDKIPSHRRAVEPPRPAVSRTIEEIGGAPVAAPEAPPAADSARARSASEASDAAAPAPRARPGAAKAPTGVKEDRP